MQRGRIPLLKEAIGLIKADIGNDVAIGTYVLGPFTLAGLDILKPHVTQLDLGVKGSVVIGTVEGDVHDIGKNIVKMMFDVTRFTVYDLGRDVPLDKFVEEQLRTDSDLVCLSAMMTTTMVGMKKVIDNLKAKNPI